ncbi:MAG: glycoside hydrolase family 1 protein [Oligoflexia bacterium]|nr:glycoside hydrolase family 1 protein [Oligoflexia bacterium]
MILLLTVLLACSADQVADTAALAARPFPDGFMWGISMAGFQSDPGCPGLSVDDCEDPNSDWYVWVTDPDLIAEPGNYLSGEPLSDGPGYWELYPQDLAMAAQDLNLQLVRTSIEWSRIFPNDPTDDVQTVDDLAQFADADAVAAYHAQFQTMRDLGLEPMITLNHYTLPTWLHDAKGCHQDLSTCEDKGWADHDRMLHHIALYAGYCAREFGDQVDWWLTLNEPLAVVLSGYLMPSEDRTNPPGVSDPETAFAVMLTQIEAHAVMYDAIHENDSTASVGSSPNLVAVTPLDPTDDVDVLGTEHLDYLYNRVFLNGIVRGEWDADLDGTVDEIRDDLVGRSDFIGVNYYNRITVDGLGFPILGQIPIFDFLPTGDYFESYPQGMDEVVTLAAEYDLPIVITENGNSNWSGDPTADFLLPHLSALADAIDAGADVRGYCYWSLTDNYEWNHGMAYQFGLAEVDPDTKARSLRPMALDYAAIAAANGLPD